jgi:hypothetical protein
LSNWGLLAEQDDSVVGFFESYDGGETWPVQAHLPGKVHTLYCSLFYSIVCLFCFALFVCLFVLFRFFVVLLFVGFFESYDGGETWPVQAHLPGEVRARSIMSIITRLCAQTLTNSSFVGFSP